MNQYFPHLFSEIEIRGHIYKNRIETAPTMFAQAALMPGMHKPIMRMIENRAKGGQAAVILGEVGLNDKDGSSLHIAPVNYYEQSGRFFELLKEYAEIIHSYGAVAIGEICHEGQDANEKMFDAPWGSKEKTEGPDAYGPMNMMRPDGGVVKAFDIKEMERFSSELEAGCAFFRAAGFDGVMLHGGHGFIVQQFISPLFNKRTDEFGGSIENRSRFPKMMYQAMRRGLGEDGILEIRMSAEDMLPGGMTIEDTVGFAKEIDGLVDIFQVSCGIKHLGNRTHTFSDMYDAHGLNVEHARKIKAAMSKTRVSVVGGINSPELGEEIIKSGAADFIAIGRQAFADPEFANKAMAGRADEIRRCVRCFQCYPGQPEHDTDVQFIDRESMTEEEFQKMISPASMGHCAINPYCNFELDVDAYPVPEISKKVLIIGGGVAGMQSSITAAERGHKVTLIERTDALGGILKFTDNDILKEDLRNFKNELILEVKKKVPDIRLNTEFSKALVEEIKPDHAIICIGSEEVRPAIKGACFMTDALDVYKDNFEIKGSTGFKPRAVVVGGGTTGCETALYLNEEKGANVIVLKRSGRLAPDCKGSYRAGLIDEMDRVGVKYILEMKTTQVTSEGVYGLNTNGEEVFFPADIIVNACGMESRDISPIIRLLGEIPYDMVGDCRHVAKVGHAITEAAIVALNIK